MIVRETLRNAPDPGTKTKSRFPHEYRNSEGPGSASYPLFNDSETGGQQLHEYPLKLPHERPFDYNKNKTQMGKIHATIRKHGKPADLGPPPNETGPARVVTTTERRTVGVMYHPDGNPKGFAKASLGALDRQGRESLREYRDRTTKPSRVSTIPYREY